MCIRRLRDKNTMVHHVSHLGALAATAVMVRSFESTPSPTSSLLDISFELISKFLVDIAWKYGSTQDGCVCVCVCKSSHF